MVLHLKLRCNKNYKELRLQKIFNNIRFFKQIMQEIIIQDKSFNSPNLIRIIVFLMHKIWVRHNKNNNNDKFNTIHFIIIICLILHQIIQ